jgi:DNA polymerase-3 subunit epsilon
MVILDSNGKCINRTVVLDIETTGLSPEHGDRVIEVGAIALEGKSIVNEFHSLIDTERPIDPDAGRIHRITKYMLCGQPKAEYVFQKFHRFIEESVLVAHYAAFDLSFIAHEFGRLKLDLRQPYLCTLALGRKMFPDLDRHDLGSLYRHLYNSEAEIKHRALEDAKVTAKIWIKLD